MIQTTGGHIRCWDIGLSVNYLLGILTKHTKEIPEAGFLKDWCSVLHAPCIASSDNVAAAFSGGICSSFRDSLLCASHWREGWLIGSLAWCRKWTRDGVYRAEEKSICPRFWGFGNPPTWGSKRRRVDAGQNDKGERDGGKHLRREICQGLVQMGCRLGGYMGM